MSAYPAKYYRESQNWHKLLGKTGVVEFVTKVEVTTPELESFLPYCFLLVVLDSGKRIEVMGEAQTIFEIGDQVRLELRKAEIPDQISIIPYTLKAVKL